MSDLKDETIKDVLKSRVMYKSYFTKYFKDVNPQLKMPRQSPQLEGIEKGHVVDIWAEKYPERKEIIMVIRINLREKKEE